MKKKLKTILLLFLFLLACSNLPAQQNGEAYNPETANGANNIYYQYHLLKWENPADVIYNEIYLSYDSSKVANLDSSALFNTGIPNTVYDSIVIDQQLHYPTRYFWCVVEHYPFGFVMGEVWYFTTTRDRIDFLEMDDFSFGLGKWNINNGNNCGWQIGDQNNYLLPEPSTGNLLTADASLCGNSMEVSATFHQVDNMQYMWAAKLEFNSDWFTDNPSDDIRIEMKTNLDIFWTTIWSKDGISDRNKHYDIDLFYENWISNDTITYLRLRFNTDQNGTNSWWTVDNVAIKGHDGVLTHVHPISLHTNIIAENNPKVKLSWNQILPTPNSIVERKLGLPTDSSIYEIVGNVSGTINSTFIDSTVKKSTVYTYRVGINEGGFGNFSWYVYSNEATTYIPDIPTTVENNSEVVLDFILSQNYPNPFNPSTKIKFIIPNHVIASGTKQSALTTLKVYDVLGNEVAALVNEELSAGEYEVEFSATGGGTSLTSGIYFYKLQAGEFVETKKMVLLK